MAGFAQISDDEAPIQQAFAKLRGENEIMLTLDGSERIGSRVNTLSSNAFFKWEPLKPDYPGIKAEINDWVNGEHTRRIVADGTILWNYDFTRNAYTTFRYGSYNGALPEGYRINMLNELTTATQGPSVFLSRALKEVFSGNGAQYRTWLPMSQITVIGDGMYIDDPVIPSRRYTGTQNDLYIVYTYASRLQRSGAFHLQRSGPLSDWHLSEIFYADRQQLNASTSKTVDWMISVTTGTMPTVPRYTFVPPTTAKSIANVRGGG